MVRKSNIVEALISEIKRIALKVNLKPAQLTKEKFLGNTRDFKEWDLRKVGGLPAILKAHFPQDDKDLIVIQDQKQTTARLNKLEQFVGNAELFRNKLITSIVKEVSRMRREPLILNDRATRKYLKEIAHKSKDKTTGRSICTVWSDQHFGTDIDPAEVGGINAFNWGIGARRLGMLCEQIATFKIETRGEHDELVIFLAGDNIAGVIHDQEAGQLITTQICGAVKYYTQALDYLRQFFPKIRVECQPGNHGRMMHKAEKGRAMQNKWDSFENAIFMSLSAAFRHDAKVEINVPKTPFCDTTVQGHRIYSTHGDTVFYVGNPGKVVNLTKIEQQVHRINAEQGAQGKKKFSLFCTGHVHHPVYTHVGAGVKIVINGCLIGTDPYAMSVGIQSSNPVQVLWETTKKYVQGDIRNIYVDDADKEKRYEDIIKPYTGELTIN